jgi:hypothetical protein
MKPLLTLIQEHRAQLKGKPEDASGERKAEAARLTRLFEASRGKGYSFIRLGDFDVALLLAGEEGETNPFPSETQVSGTHGLGSPGLETHQVPRLRRALEEADYVDFHEVLWKSPALLDRLKLNRAPGLDRNPNALCSYILPAWLEHEFKDYCKGRTILFCGAEAPLLEEMIKQPGFERHSRGFWPKGAKIHFLRPREDGRNLSKNLDLIASDIAREVKLHGVDTVFLSLGGGAKILCHELAQSLHVTAIDFGAFLRSLTYSGSDGNRASRATHTVFLFWMPYDQIMDAMERAYRDFSDEEFLAKAHAQLLLEVQEKEVGWSHSAWEYDFSPLNRQRFTDGVAEYKRRYSRLFNKSPGTRRERAEFLHFCGVHRLTWEGILFLAKFNVKSKLARVLKGKKTG